MLASFVLAVIDRALGDKPNRDEPMPCIWISSNEHVDRKIERFQGLWRDWVDCSRVQYEDQCPELDKLFARTARVMAASSVIFSDLRTRLPANGRMAFSSARLIKILRTTNKAITAGQRITHTGALQQWWIPDDASERSSTSDESVEENQHRHYLNERAKALHERRKKPIQCCMFVALVFFQFLYGEEPHDLVAEYEDEVVSDTFDRTLSIDDAKTYASLQLQHHCRARLTPPQNRIPRLQIPYSEESCVPRFVRNPMTCGAAIVSNQNRLNSNEKDYMNLNCNNKPQHLLAQPSVRDTTYV